MLYPPATESEGRVELAELIGERIREAREVNGWTQQELGDRLEPHLGRAWSRQAVSNAEKGGREFTAAELVAFSRVLERTIPSLFSATDQTVGMPGDEDVSATDLLACFGQIDVQFSVGVVDALDRLTDSIAVHLRSATARTEHAQQIVASIRDETKDEE